MSVPTLLGVGVEYISSAVAFFERLRQIEEASEHIIVLAGPVSFLLASDAFGQTLEEVLAESIPKRTADRTGRRIWCRELIPILRRRKDNRRKLQARHPKSSPVRRSIVFA